MPAPLTVRQRNQQLALRAATLRELHRLWPTLDPARLDATFPGWLAAVSRLVGANRNISAALAARYLREFRLAAGIGGDAAVVLAEPVPPAQLVAAMRVTSLVSMKRAAAVGTALPVAAAKAFVASSGAATRLVLDGGRETILASLAADSRARGWKRVASGRACSFCRMLASREGVYSAGTVDFRSHDHCACGPEPVWS